MSGRFSEQTNWRESELASDAAIPYVLYQLHTPLVDPESRQCVCLATLPSLILASIILGCGLLISGDSVFAMDPFDGCCA